MKTLEQIAKEYTSNTLDGRDLHRLAQFIPFNKLEDFGLELNEGVTEEDWEVKEFTKENVLAQLKEDVEFGFRKALDKRGISAGMMFEVVMMWNWVLEEGLEDYDTSTGYAQYGLPLLKATALKYGFNNPIGDDEGNEFEYSADSDY